MPKEEIVEGLKTAIAKGESLQKAMMSFYNAGYAKQDIEEAARALSSPQILQYQQPTVQQPQATAVQPQFQQPQQLPPVQPSPQQAFQLQPPIQRVSSYGEKRPSRLSSILIFLLVFFLLVLFGALIAIFLFKDEVANFFNGVL